MYDLTDKRIWVSGHLGMVGSAIASRLRSERCDLLVADRSVDLRDAVMVRKWMDQHRPQAMIIAAGKVGGILANSTQPADFIYDNLAIAINLIHEAHRVGVEKLLYLGSSCIYPKLAPQPIPESALLSGPLEPTNQWYAIAKISGIFLCKAYREQFGDDFISAMPTNLYGENDNFDLVTSHVLPALLRKIHEAKRDGCEEVEIWGTGSPQREFMHVDDLADACVFLLKNYSDGEHINIGSGSEISIRQLAENISDVVGYRGSLRFDTSKPDGTPRKLMDSSRLQALGWMPTISLTDGLKRTYDSFSNSQR